MHKTLLSLWNKSCQLYARWKQESRDWAWGITPASGKGDPLAKYRPTDYSRAPWLVWDMAAKSSEYTATQCWQKASHAYYSPGYIRVAEAGESRLVGITQETTTDGPGITLTVYSH